MRKLSFIFMVLILLLAACAPAPSTKSADGPSVKHAMGTTKVPKSPKRVVVLTNEGLEALLSVGIKPVGAVHAYIGGKTWYKHLEKEMAGIKDVGTEDQPNLDVITSLKPDLIIGNKMRQEKVYKQLSGIAPTVFAEKLKGDWQTNFTLYTKTVNKEKEGKVVLDQFDQRIADLKSKAGDKLKWKVSLVRFVAGETRIYNKDTFGGVILEKIGFARPNTQNKNTFMDVVSKERIPDMDGDILFYFLYETGDGEASKLRDEWQKDRLWNQLEVVKQKKAFQVDDIIWTTAGGAKAANLLLDDIEKYILK